MKSYQFDLVKHAVEPKKDYSWVEHRPLIDFSKDLEIGARFFVPGNKLEIAINTAIAVGEPLLITGDPGTGKTQVAYYIAYKLELELLHFQVKSTSKAQELLYTFDTVRYFHDAHFTDAKELDKRNYINEGDLWKALENSDKPCVLLIDEIDKAPRDFPNDLLRELDQMEFDVPELSTRKEKFKVPKYDRTDENERKRRLQNRPIVIISSNSERRLPEPFLRRCIYHHIPFDRNLLKEAVYARRNEYKEMSDDFLNLAITKFIKLYDKRLRKKSSTGELITWLRVMAAASKADLKYLDCDLSELPYLGVLLKDNLDIEEVVKS